MPSRRRQRVHPLEDRAFLRQVERLVGEQRQALPDAGALDVMARVTDADIIAAERLWDEAQRQAGTGLAGLLSAVPETEHV